MSKVDIKKIESIFFKIFPNIQKQAILELKLGDVEEWDSLGNFNFLLAIEDFYKIRFSIEQMTDIKSIKKLIEVLERKIN